MNEIVTVEENQEEKETLEFDWLKLHIAYNDNDIEISIKDNYVRDKKPIHEEIFINKVSPERKKQGEFLKIITKTLYSGLYNNLKNILPIELTDQYFGHFINSNLKELDNSIIVSTTVSNTDASSYLSTIYIIPIIIDSLKNLEIKLNSFTFETLFSKDFQDYTTKTISLDDNSFDFLTFKKEKDINIIINNQEENLRTIVLDFSFKEKNKSITFRNIDILKNDLSHLVFEYINFYNTKINGSNKFNVNTQHLTLENYIFSNFIFNEIYKSKILETLALNNCTFEESISMYPYYFETTPFKELSFSQDCIFLKEFSINLMTFDKLSFTDCTFNQLFRINKCKIINDFLLNNCTINNKSSLSETVFCNDCIIHETTFNESINLSNVSVGSIFNIATSSVNNLIFSNIKFLENKSTEIKLYDYKIYFNNLIKKINNTKRIKYNLGKPHNYYETENIRASFAMLKNACLANNNIIDANFFHALELLFYKAELSKRSIFEKIEYKEIIPNNFASQKLIDENIVYDNYISKSKEATHWFSKINGRLLTDKFLLWLNEFISNHHQNTFRAICMWLGFGFLSSVLLVLFFDTLIGGKYTLEAKTFTDILLEITFPFYSAPDGILMGIFKIISIYIIWQIIKSARNSFR